MSTNNPVVIGVDKKVEASEAAKFLGCAYSTIVALLDKKKLKGQKINRRWFIEYDDLQRAKATHLVRARLAKRIQPKIENIKKEENQIEMKDIVNNGTIDVKLNVDPNKFKFVEVVLSSADKTVSQYLSEKIEELYEKIKESMKNLKV